MKSTTSPATVAQASPAGSPVGQPDQAEQRLRALMAEYRSALFAYVLNLTDGDAAWAEDVVQEAFIRAWRHWERMTPEHGSVRGWMMRVARNLVMDEYRLARRRRGEVPFGPWNDVAAPESTDQFLSAHIVRTALKSLPEVHRQALEATYLADQTAARAAVVLGVPVGTVKSRVFYGLRMLRDIVEQSAAA